MALEIERKFILRNNPLKLAPYASGIIILEMIQVYLEVGGIKNRIRQTRKKFARNSQYILCNKTLISHGTYEEIESESNEETFKEYLDNPDSKSLSKTRYILEENGLNWEVDVYDGISLVTLEVELSDINQEIIIPGIIEDEIIMEVTGTKELTNYNLSR